MARHKSAMKQLRASQRKYTRNINEQSKLKTLVRKVDQALASGNKDNAKANLKTAIASLQRAASRNIIHKNTASRKISRLMKIGRKSEVTV